MSVAKRWWLILSIIAVAALGWAANRYFTGPKLEPFSPLVLSPAPADFVGLRVIFFGVSTLLLDDGETAILTDGFFTRPEADAILFGKIAPDRDVIARSLDRAGIRKLAAVIAVHSHFDHVLDSPEVAQRTGAVLIGSSSTINVGRGWGLPDDRLRLMHDGEVMRFGKFEVTIIRSAHHPQAFGQGEIDSPLHPPVSASEYREGGSYQLLVHHDDRSLLINGSAGFVAGALAGRNADVVYLGIGGLGRDDDSYRSAYWDQVVHAVHAKRVIPIHWDNLTRPLDKSLLPAPYLFDDMDKSMQFLLQRGQADNVDVRLELPWIAVDPFQGLGK